MSDMQYNIWNVDRRHAPRWDENQTYQKVLRQLQLRDDLDKLPVSSRYSEWNTVFGNWSGCLSSEQRGGKQNSAAAPNFLGAEVDFYYRDKCGIWANWRSDMERGTSQDTYERGSYVVWLPRPGIFYQSCWRASRKGHIVNKSNKKWWKNGRLDK